MLSNPSTLCATCNVVIELKKSTARFCSPRCRVAANRKKQKQSELFVGYCECCGHQYFPNNITSRFCSHACKQQWYRYSKSQHRFLSEIDLNDYDIVHLGMSGGKDSTALLLWVLYESGVDRAKLRVSFCDTGNEDRFTYEFIGMLSERLFPIETITPERDFYELAKHKRRFPSTKARFCTQYLKVIPSRNYLREFTATSDVIALNGVRASESIERSKLSAFDYDSGLGCDTYRPLLHCSLFDIWRLHRQYLPIEWCIELVQADSTLKPEHKETLIKRYHIHKIPRNPLYDMGASRVGCYPCINSRKLEIRAMSHYRPERVEYIAEQELAINPSRGGSTFFPIDKTPERFKTRSYPAKDGRIYAVPTIYDVVRWAATGKRAAEVEYTPPPLPCDSEGLCE